MAVALGEPKHAERYCGKLAPSIDCYCNQTTEVYEAYGLQQMSVLGMLNPAMYKASLRASSAGHRQGQATGDTRMLPGTFVVDTAGIIQYAYYSAHAGDHPDLKELAEKVARSA